MSQKEKMPEYDRDNCIKELSEPVSLEHTFSMAVKEGEEDNDVLNAERLRTYKVRNEAVHDIAELLKGDIRENELSDAVWNAIESFQGYLFQTYQGLCFTYSVKGYEIFVDRKTKSITKSSVDIALMKAVELQGNVSGPKKLKVFGASYLYPVFIRLGIIKTDGKSL